MASKALRFRRMGGIVVQGLKAPRGGFYLRALIASALLGASAHVAYAIEPRQPQAPVEEPAEQQPRTQAAPRDNCVQARADWGTISNTNDIELLRSFIRTLPRACEFQRAQAERRLTSLLADAARPPIQYSPISLGQRVQGALSSTDGRMTSSEYVDGYRFSGRAGQRITINLRSSAFDAYLVLIPPVGAQIDVDDAEATGTDSRIDHALQLDGEYIILATSFQPGETGAYELALAVQPAPTLVASPRVSPPQVTATPQAPSALQTNAGQTLIWSSLPDEQTLARVYPLAARSQQREGRVVLDCRVGNELTAACAVVSETPAGLGFGDAALEAARSLRVTAFRTDGVSSIGTQTEVVLNFRLDAVTRASH